MKRWRSSSRQKLHLRRKKSNYLFCFHFFFNFKLFLNRSSSAAAGMRSIREDNCIKRLLILGCKKRHYMLQKNEATSEMALNALGRHHKSIKNRQPLLQQKIKQLLKQLWTLWEYISHSCWKSINVSKFGCGFFLMQIGCNLFAHFLVGKY